LSIGIIAMLFCSIYQYSWNAFAPLLAKDFNATVVQIELAFTLFIIFSTFTQILSGYLADIYGPRIIGVVASILMSGSLVLSSLAPNINFFYITWSIGSAGVGIIFGLSLNLAIKWFEDRKGLASGLVSMSWGMGGALFNPFILQFESFREPMLILGIASLLITPTLYSLAKYPKSTKGKDPISMVKELNFWLLYLSFGLIVVPLLLSSSSLPIIANFLSKPEYALLIIAFPISNGLGRPILGYISDKIGRIRGILLINILMVLSVLLLIVSTLYTLSALLFISIILIGMLGGATLPVYMAFIGEIYGTKFSTSNTAILYTAKAVSGILGSVFFAITYLIYGYFSLYLVLLFTVISTITIFILTKHRLA